jgi:nitroreductase
MKLNLTADEVLTTTRSVRKRLDFDKPVARSVVEECLQIALQAPTGSNSQGWQWIVVEDAAKKKALADIYKENFSI